MCKGRSSYRHGSAITFAVSSPILYVTSSPEPLLPEIRRVLVQTLLPFRSMTAARCGRGCTFVAPPIQCTQVSKCPGNVRCQLCAIRSRPSPRCTDQPRKATIVQDLATLWEQHRIDPFIAARKAYNPHIKGRVGFVNHCPQPPHLCFVCDSRGGLPQAK